MASEATDFSLAIPAREAAEALGVSERTLWANTASQKTSVWPKALTWPTLRGLDSRGLLGTR